MVRIGLLCSLKVRIKLYCSNSGGIPENSLKPTLPEVLKTPFQTDVFLRRILYRQAVAIVNRRGTETQIRVIPQQNLAPNPSHPQIGHEGLIRHLCPGRF